VGHLAGWLIGKWKDHIFLTREEIAGLMQNLLCTHSEPAGRTWLTDWVREHASTRGSATRANSPDGRSTGKPARTSPEEARRQRTRGKRLAQALRSPCPSARAPSPPLTITLAGRAQPAVR